MAALGHAHARLAGDPLNGHYATAACTVAVGWRSVIVQETRPRPILESEVLRFRPDRRGRLMRVAVRVEGANFAETRLSSVETSQRRE